jgi:hypothetical protein
MMEPLISIQIQGNRPYFEPAGKIICDYQIDAVPADEILSVEACIAWYTEGKGDEDMGVHYFERRLPSDVEDGDLRAWRRFESVLPNSPLSYDGELIRLRWCVRVRAFLKHGRQYHTDMPFTLGDVGRVLTSVRS